MPKNFTAQTLASDQQLDAPSKDCLVGRTEFLNPTLYAQKALVMRSSGKSRGKEALVSFTGGLS